MLSKNKTTSSKERDSKIIKKILRGHKDCYRELVELYQEKAIRLAYSIMGNYDEARDVAQDAFVKAYEALSKFRNDSSFSTWLYRIVANKAKDYCRKKTDIPIEGEKLSFHIDAAVNPKSKRQEMQELCVASAVENLSSNQRSAVTLRYWHGLSYFEISEVMGIAEGTVKATLHQAAGNLKKLLIQDGEGALS